MLIFPLTIFLSAFLLFQVQPMIAKMILPWFGGSAAVWITAMLFFQTALLGGYLYAHWSVRSLSHRSQAILQAMLLLASLLLLPITPLASWKPGGGEDPISGILGVLAASVGLPYFLLSTTSPLIQAWYSRKYRSVLPYRLFGLSNFASLLGLLAYPVLVEPFITLRLQSILWSTLYAVFVLLAATAAFASLRSSRERVHRTAAGETTEKVCGAIPGPLEQVLWMLLSTCSSALLLAVTNHLTQNVASIPFLWVLPLGLYLLSFTIIFDFEGLYHRRTFFWLALAALGAMSFGLVKWNSHTDIRLIIATYSGGLFVLCLFLHGELVRRKPPVGHLTTFYFMLSLGGAIGGLLVGIAAPKLLPGYFELPIALLAFIVLLLALLDYRTGRITVMTAWALAAGVTFAGWSYYDSYRSSSLATGRNFYGSLRVYKEDHGTDDEARALVHGTVDHGMQFTSPDRSREHITYYGPESGIALALTAVRRSPVRVAVIGLGAGSLASYSRPGDVFRFYEINPLVETFARRDFTYLSEARGKIEVVLGDGRLSLEREEGTAYDLIAVDAFSGDAIPAHLVTREAMQLYFRRLAPGGILVLHITNTHLDLEPVVAAAARDQRLHACLIKNLSDPLRRIYRSDWALLSKEPLRNPKITDAADNLLPRENVPVWTDDYSNLFRILKRRDAEGAD